MARHQVFPQFFNAERLGQSLKEVSSDLLKVESKNLIGRWFHAADEIDLFIWSDEDKKIVKQQLTFFGQVVEWNVVEGTKTGAIIEDETLVGKGNVNASEMIRFDDRPQPQPLGLAMDLINHTGALKDTEKREIITNYFRGQKFSDLAPDEFIQRYAQSVASPSWFVRLVNFLRWFLKR